jgi:hypothetical protein
MTAPRWVISTSPSHANANAMLRLWAVSSCQSSPPTARAASDGQMLEFGPRCRASARIAARSRVAAGPPPSAD